MRSDQQPAVQFVLAATALIVLAVLFATIGPIKSPVFLDKDVRDDYGENGSGIRVIDDRVRNAYTAAAG